MPKSAQILFWGMWRFAFVRDLFISVQLVLSIEPFVLNEHKGWMKLIKTNNRPFTPLADYVCLLVFFFFKYLTRKHMQAPEKCGEAKHCYPVTEVSKALHLVANVK